MNRFVNVVECGKEFFFGVKHELNDGEHMLKRAGIFDFQTDGTPDTNSQDVVAKLFVPVDLALTRQLKIKPRIQLIDAVEKIRHVNRDRAVIAITRLVKVICSLAVVENFQPQDAFAQINFLEHGEKFFFETCANVGNERTFAETQRQDIIALRIFDGIFSGHTREVRFAAAEGVIKVYAAIVDERFDDTLPVKEFCLASL